jgi:hypothetical protein
MTESEAQAAREAEVAALIERSKDPDDEYDGSDAMSHPEGDA